MVEGSVEIVVVIEVYLWEFDYFGSYDFLWWGFYVEVSTLVSGNLEEKDNIRKHRDRKQG